VTALICVWRRFAVPFDERYAKTGGGEDVDFCLRVVERAGCRRQFLRDEEEVLSELRSPLYINIYELRT